MSSAASADWAVLAHSLKARDGTACQWRVAAHPVGNVKPTDFAWHEEPVPSPEKGEVLLETLYLGLAPVMRMYMQGTGAAGERKLGVGDAIHGRGVARILESRHPDWKAGEIHVGRWREVMAEMAGWIRTGKLKPVQDVVDGFESMPEALSRLYDGRNIGVQCCRVRPEPDRPELKERPIV